MVSSETCPYGWEVEFDVCIIYSSRALYWFVYRYSDFWGVIVCFWDDGSVPYRYSNFLGLLSTSSWGDGSATYLTCVLVLRNYTCCCCFGGSCTLIMRGLNLFTLFVYLGWRWDKCEVWRPSKSGFKTPSSICCWPFQGGTPSFPWHVLHVIVLNL